MESAEGIFTIVLVMVNLVAGFGCAIPIARLLGKVNNKPKSIFRYFIILIGIYLLECAAFAAGMATQVFSVVLAFLWGLILGLWLRGRASSQMVLKAAFFLSLYASLPTVSFSVVLPAMRLICGSEICSTGAGARFGIPDFLPWPVNTMLGFCVALAVGTVLLKTIITTGEVGLLIHLSKKPEGHGS